MKANKFLMPLALVALVAILACSSPAATSPTATSPPKTTAPTATASPTTQAPSPKPAVTPGQVSFAGKTVTLVVPLAAGGSSDIVARVYSRFLPKYLPGNPAVVVRNMPGGGATIGANYAYGAKPDGLTVLVTPAAVNIAYVTHNSAVRYDLQKMEALIGTSTTGLFYTKPGIVSKAEDLPGAKGVIFGYGPVTGSHSYLFVTVVNLLDFKPDKVVLAYSGSADSFRAFLSGEVNMTATLAAQYWDAVDPLVAKKEVQLLFQSGGLDKAGDIVRHSAMPADLVTVKEVYQKIYGKPPGGVMWDAYKGLIAASLGYTYCLLPPPGAPDGVLKAWRAAIQNMVNDTQFRQTADPLLGKGAQWLVGEDFSKEFKANLTMDTKVLDWLRTALQKYGVEL